MDVIFFYFAHVYKKPVILSVDLALLKSVIRCIEPNKVTYWNGYTDNNLSINEYVFPKMSIDFQNVSIDFWFRS